MAKVSISLIFNTKTGKKDIHVDFESDADALPFEHEKEHRKLIEKLIGSNLLKAEEAGEIIVQRGEGEIVEESRREQSSEGTQLGNQA